MVLATVLPLSLRAQLVVKLSPQTLSEFDSYAAGIEGELNERWAARKPFLAIEDGSGTTARVRNGELFVEQMNGGQPREITNGLIHDWRGAVYIPHTTIEQVVDLLKDFDRHHEVYPAVARSHTIRHEGQQVSGYWRLEQKGLVPVVLDVEQDVRYTRLAPGKWKGEAFARHIIEIDTGLFARGHAYPPDEGHGYLWRLYAFWSLERSGDGVLAECRTLSLSRDIPSGLAWAVAPYVQKMPRQSLMATLKDTREAFLK